MHSRTESFLLHLALPVLLALGALDPASAEPTSHVLSRDGAVIHGGPVRQAKAVVDTINLMATRDDPTNGPGEPVYLGDFESPGGAPDWNGWTSVDLTRPTETHWQVSNYLEADPGDLVAWCGDINFPSCDNNLDPPGGYGNNWYDVLEFRQSVPHPEESTLVTLTGHLQVEVEPGYDFVILGIDYIGQGITSIASWGGTLSTDLDESVTFFPADYKNGSEVTLSLRYDSDGGFSDADCAYPTHLGAARLDDLAVHLVNGPATLDFFTDFQDGTFGDWTPVFPGVGDFAQIWTGLQDLDPCADNFTPQVAFIDDGQVVPGTGGSTCINWCYGPGGYIVNTTGGIWESSYYDRHHLDNSVRSPVMAWPDDALDGARLTFDVYVHEDLSADAPGMFYDWAVRSADTDGSAGGGVQDIEDQPWVNREFYYYGGPEYRRHDEEVTDLMNPGRDQVQVQLSVQELGQQWGWIDDDGYPAPYFDNVKFQVYDHPGPVMAAREIDLAGDGFPEQGVLDFGDLGTNHVRFDMARNIVPAYEGRVDFGDSIVLDITPIRAGSVLHGVPELHYRLWPNPVFDPHRSAGLPIEGSVPGVDVGDVWAFDLPDTGFLFPGDVLYYYLRAQDSLGGADVRTALMPPDTTGFGADPANPLAYDRNFTVRVLPTVLDDGAGGYETPPILFWNDFGSHGSDVTWHDAFRQLGMIPGVDYDFFATRGPGSGADNGLGVRAGSDLTLEHYTDMLYSCGDLGLHTLADGSYKNPGDDVGVLTNWLQQGYKDIFLTGDNLATDLAVNAGPSAFAFAQDIMGLSFQHEDVRSFIDNQTNPMVEAAEGNPVFQNTARWVAFGGCPGINTFDGVVMMAGAQRLAEFTDPGGAVGAYIYSAATLNVPATPGTSRILSLPYDFATIRTPAGAKASAPQATRVLLLEDIIGYFGLPSGGIPTATIPGLAFTAANHPNPFNPVTRIVYTVPKTGYLSLKVYDIRGMLVRTLVDDRVEAGADHVAVWDGTDEGGAAVSSGVYFYEARTGGEVKVGKMALVK